MALIQTNCGLIGGGRDRHQRSVCTEKDQLRESSCLQARERSQEGPWPWLPCPPEMSIWYLSHHQAVVFFYGSPKRLILPETWSLCIFCQTPMLLVALLPCFTVSNSESGCLRWPKPASCCKECWNRPPGVTSFCRIDVGVGSASHQSA